jgi:peroxiredoxin family protein
VKKICFIISKNDFETFYKMLILGTTGAAMDVKMYFFFTFWGLKLLKKGNKPRVAGMRNGMKRMAGWMFRRKMEKFGYKDPEMMLRKEVKRGKVKLFPCSMTFEMMGFKKEEMWDFVEEPVGAATFLEQCDGADSIIHM